MNPTPVNTQALPTFDTPIEGGRAEVVQPTQETAVSSFDVPWDIFTSAWINFFLVALIVSVVFAIITLYARFRLYQIRSAEAEYYTNQPLSSAARKVLQIEEAASMAGGAHEARWRDVLRLADSAQPNDWRQAIVEADIMLEDAITQKGYQGESLGEKMKTVRRSEVNTIDGAWEAHKMRNRIAHEGAAMELSQREVKRIIALFERTLRELDYIFA